MIPDTEDFSKDCTYFIVFRANGLIDQQQYLIRNLNRYNLAIYLNNKTKCYTTSIDSTALINIASLATTNNYDYHILAVTWTDGMLVQYLDGSTKDVLYASGSDAALKEAFSNVQTIIGQAVRGEIAEIIIYNRALDQDEVAATGLSLAKKFSLNWEGVEAEFDETGAPGETTDQQPPANGNTSTKWLMAIIAGAIIALGGIITAVTVAVKRKKSAVH